MVALQYLFVHIRECCLESLNRKALRYLSRMNGWEFYGLQDAAWYSKLMFFLRVPITLFLRFTSPIAVEPWNKPLALIHCFTMPIICIFAFGRESFNLNVTFIQTTFSGKYKNN
jgi:hypothetical protein